MSTNASREPVGLKLRYGPGGAERAADVARTLIMPPLLEADDSLAPDAVVLDVSYHDGEVTRDAAFEPFIDRVVHGIDQRRPFVDDDAESNPCEPVLPPTTPAEREATTLSVGQARALAFVAAL